MSAEMKSENVEDESTAKKIPFNTTKFDIKEKYEKLKGKSLYLRFPKKLPTDQNDLENLVKTICDRVIKVRRLRQKSSRCCLIDFNTKDERDESLTKLNKVEINGKRLLVKIPRTENEKFLEKIIEKAELKREQKKAKNKLKKEAAKAKKLLTSSIIVKNVSQDTPLSDFQALFPNAIEILRTKVNSEDGKDILNIKFPTVEDAHQAQSKNLTLNGQKLNIMYDIQKSKKINNKGKNVKKPGPSQKISKNFKAKASAKKAKGNQH